MTSIKTIHSNIVAQINSTAGLTDESRFIMYNNTITQKESEINSIHPDIDGSSTNIMAMLRQSCRNGVSDGKSFDAWKNSVSNYLDTNGNEGLFAPRAEVLNNFDIPMVNNPVGDGISKSDFESQLKLMSNQFQNDTISTS